MPIEVPAGVEGRISYYLRFAIASPTSFRSYLRGSPWPVLTAMTWSPATASSCWQERIRVLPMPSCWRAIGTLEATHRVWWAPSYCTTLRFVAHCAQQPFVNLSPRHPRRQAQHLRIIHAIVP